MPNPLARVGTPKRQKTEPPDRPAPLAPIPEATSEPNFPYRGSETHGVKPTGSPADFSGYEGTVDAFFEIEPEPEHVVPVRIVQGNDARQRRVGRAFQIPVIIGGDPVQIIGRNDRRVKLLVRVLPANVADVLLIGGTREEVDPMNGYRITGITVPYEFTHDGQSRLWANAPVIGGGSAAGTVVSLSCWEIVTVDL